VNQKMTPTKKIWVVKIADRVDGWLHPNLYHLKLHFRMNYKVEDIDYDELVERGKTYYKFDKWNEWSKPDKIQLFKMVVEDYG
jgi:hypothetical protein